MDKALFRQLNAVYAPLWDRAVRLTGALNQAGFEVTWGWYAGHSVLIDGGWQTEAFPIPVVEAAGLFDAGFNLDGCWLEFQLSRAAALVFRWDQLPEGAEVCGVEDYLLDFYHARMDVDGIAGRIADSQEQAVTVALAFPPDIDDAALLAAAEDCRRWKSGTKDQ